VNLQGKSRENVSYEKPFPIGIYGKSLRTIGE